MEKKPIYVTEPHLPDFDSYVELLRGIWDRKLLTNQGPLVRQLESSLQSCLGLEHEPLAVCNGSLGLQIALKTLPRKGKIITTPFSYVATASCPLWEGFDVKFADIEPDYLTLDPKKVEPLINENTVAILGTHVFGNPCDVEAFEKLGNKYDLPIIYDAAHAFGVKYKGRSILEWGDASMVSFHATKLFHTVEGGMVYSPDRSRLEKMEWMRRFGHDGPDAFHGVGINAKLSEVHAAVGLATLAEIDLILEKRKSLYELYMHELFGCEYLTPSIQLREGVGWNYSYFPVLFETEIELTKALSALESSNYIAKRYFHPALNRSNEVVGSSCESCPVAESVSARSLALPFASSYTDAQVRDVCRIIKTSRK